ncbi:MAG: 4-hydroxy-tetrahydrodipicolinate synthase [Firmicutes bacterium]|nr:4-hydroxy-tetrahydrodipicolinate synthase [Bacillota bacterium]
MSLFKGSGVALVTPFRDGRIDYTALEKLIAWHMEKGTDAIIVCGTTGEASTLSPVEKLSLVEFTVKQVDHQIPVIAGSGSNDTSHSMYLSKEMQYVGADGLLVVTPYYNKATQNGLIQHYTAIADYVDIPIILYSVKSRTGLNIEPKTVKALKEHPNICGIKEASGDITQICKIASLIDNKFDLYSGNDDHTIPMMSLGAVGCISTVANIIPAEYHQMVSDYLKGRHKAAAKMQIAMLPLIQAVFAEVNPIPIKAAMHMMGLIAKEYRLPMCEPTNETLYLLYDEMTRYGIKLK